MFDDFEKKSISEEDVFSNCQEEVFLDAVIKKMNDKYQNKKSIGRGAERCLSIRGVFAQTTKKPYCTVLRSQHD
ncbi:hypothetical protein BOTNAR_0106g00020 [Botryotinia narcissicola]|uniref:Uncharacterized protein n=1 Tax=Botryotinia narcissicola TaxID=278944 RepID=A0A4Z1INL9_9HELO|nr:hypothetical protein BOTNAR_0106g00020 [Botryotinia narcissicola]